MIVDSKSCWWREKDDSNKFRILVKGINVFLFKHIRNGGLEYFKEFYSVKI